jgi:hypothetical protein
MISIDSFEDTLHGNAITIRRFSPMPIDVPLHFRQCSVEGGNEAPTLGVGNSVAVSVDQNNQPVESREPGAHEKIMNVAVVWQLSLEYGGTFIFITGLIPALIFGARFFEWRRAKIRLQRTLCPACGYDLRATPDRCPECGVVPSPQAGPSRAAAVACAGIFLLIGIPICALGFGGVVAGRVHSFYDLCWAVAYVTIGSGFCTVGMLVVRKRNSNGFKSDSL